MAATDPRAGLSSAAHTLILRLVDDEIARRQMILCPTDDEFAAYKELSARGLAESYWQPGDWFFHVYATDGGRFYVGQFMARLRAAVSQ